MLSAPPDRKPIPLCSIGYQGGVPLPRSNFKNEFSHSCTGKLHSPIQTDQRAKAAYFPNNPDGHNYVAKSSSTSIGLIEINVAILLSPNWIICSSITHEIPADYKAKTRQQFMLVTSSATANALSVPI
jgi:hypothetical protein